MEEIGRRIQLWLSEELDLSWEEAAVLRQRYLEQHGTTMQGLMAEGSIDVAHYLEFVHDIPVEDYLDSDSELQAMLKRIELRKVIYTNATSAHALRVLRALGVAESFERIVGIEEVGLHNKFNRHAYERMLALLEAKGSECLMVEDSANNLPPAKALGVKTILIDWRGGTRLEKQVQDSVDFVVADVLEVEQIVDRFLQLDRDSGLPLDPRAVHRK